MESTVTSTSNRRFADYFVICGLDLNSGLESYYNSGDSVTSPLERPYKSKVLGHYPENVSWNPFDKDAVCMLCLPHGLHFRTQKHSLDPKFHSFVITKEDGHRYYGFSYVFYEEVRNRKMCSAMQTLQAMHITELSSGQVRSVQMDHSTRSLPRHFKLSTCQPRNAQNYYDYTKDTLFVTKCISLISQSPHMNAASVALAGIYRCWQDQSELSIESYVYNLLYEVTLPEPGRSLSFTSYPDIKVILQNPSLLDELPLFDFPIRQALSLLGVDCFIQLFTCLLLENQILLSSCDYQNLMLVSESLMCLLFPFVWPHVYVPILPASLEHFLDAPVPFVMGLCSTEPRVTIPSEANLCCIDLDNRKLQLPEELPSFPHKSALIAEVSDLFSKDRVTDQQFGCYSDHSNESLMSSSCIFPSSGWPPPRKHSWANDLDDDSDPPYMSPVLLKLVQANKNGITYDDSDWRMHTLSPKSEKLDTKLKKSHDVELQFNNSVREIFLNRFAQMFFTFEHFVIQPNQDRDEWLSNRESMQNFDKATFLSDQPQQQLPFLSRFIETQMFATLIDNKIMSTWSKTDYNLQIFENRIKNLRKRFGESLNDTSRYEPCITIRNTQKLLEKRLSNPQAEAPAPKEVLSNYTLRNIRAGFPVLDSVILNQEPSRRMQKRACNTHKYNGQEAGNEFKPLNKVPSEAKPLGIGREFAVLKPVPKTVPEASPALIAQTNWNFVEKLLKDCKVKTKRMLVEKMGTEAVELGHGIETSIVEENTMIGSLCDLLERIWSHGLQNKQGKSALWSHLCKYQQLEESGLNDPSIPIDSNLVSPDFAPMINDKDKPSRSKSETRRDSHRSSQDYKQQNSLLKPLPVSLTFDMRNVQALADVRTQVGYARAWVRLALEKKLLSRHLRTLLSNTALSKTLYKRCAFLRCEDEKEQFLYHLLTLNAVDYNCFTNTFLNIKLPFRIAIFPAYKGSPTTAECWISISGTNGSTPKIPIPKDSLEFVLQHTNLGLLTTLRIGHNNSGLSPKWLVEHIIVRNEVTGAANLFPCGRWLGRGIDDDATERLLLGKRIRDSEESSHSSRSWNYNLSQYKRSYCISDIQHMLVEAVNSIVKYFYRVHSRDTSSLTFLFCGENGLVACLEQVFMYGFKSTRIFGRNLFIWDFIVKVKEEKQSEADENLTHYFCSLVDKIQRSCQALGLEGRFRVFIAVTVRDHLFQRILVNELANSRCTQEMYDEDSFLRDEDLLLFIAELLDSLKEFNFDLEKSILGDFG